MSLIQFNTLRPRQNGRHFAEDIFKCIFFNENAWILIKISLKFVPQGPINNIPALVQIMAWCRPDDKPSSGPMMVRLPTHICVTRPQWVKDIIRSCYLHNHGIPYTGKTASLYWIGPQNLVIAFSGLSDVHRLILSINGQFVLKFLSYIASHLLSLIKQYYSKWTTKPSWNIEVPWWNHDFPDSGGRLNKKDGLTRYGNSHVKDKTS